MAKEPEAFAERACLPCESRATRGRGYVHICTARERERECRRFKSMDGRECADGRSKRETKRHAEDRKSMWARFWYCMWLKRVFFWSSLLLLLLRFVSELRCYRDGGGDVVRDFTYLKL